MFFEFNQDELTPPFRRTWSGNGEYLEDKYIQANKAWCEANNALEWEKYFPQQIVRNNTYYVFKNALYNYKTGEYWKAENGVIKPYHSQKGKTNLSSKFRKDIPMELFSNFQLPKFPREYDDVVTKVYKKL